VTTETTLTDTAAAAQIPSTAGMTTKVVKGSLWTLAGQVLPMFASLITLPIVVRVLGAEGYGLLQLIILIPNYFAFSDLGMGMASTRFAAEAFGRGDRDAEARVIRTAAFIALISSALLAVPIAIFAGPIVSQFSIPADLIEPAILGLRITSATFVVTVLATVINSPQLSRLRMDLNATIGGLTRILASVGSAAAVYLGYGIVGAAGSFLLISLLALGAHILVSRKLLGNLLDVSIDKHLIRPLLRFGAGLTASAIAAVFLLNLEKLLLSRLISVESLAYYTIAFTFASMAMMFSLSMVQSLLPAFSQLLHPEKREQFNTLFERGIKFCVIGLLPTLMFLFVLAKPFFTLWAGPDFGRESSRPFYILLAGLLFNIVAHVPYGCLVAAGKTDMIAKLHWAELIPYAAVAVVLITYFGIEGAAMAWSIRVIADAIVVIWMARTTTGATVHLRNTVVAGLFGMAVLTPPIFIVILYGNYSPLLFGAVPISLAIYSFIIWKYMILRLERDWIIEKLSLQLNKLTFAGR
jgi:O-antigen/teichoic acid export membrane protein